MYSRRMEQIVDVNDGGFVVNRIVQYWGEI